MKKYLRLDINRLVIISHTWTKFSKVLSWLTSFDSCFRYRHLIKVFMYLNTGLFCHIAVDAITISCFYSCGNPSKPWILAVKRVALKLCYLIIEISCLSRLPTLNMFACGMMSCMFTHRRMDWGTLVHSTGSQFSCAFSHTPNLCQTTFVF